MKLKLAVFCLAYNHEKFIAKALDGFLMQKANFDFQVIIGEDGSTDSTARIINDYAARYPNIIKAVFHKENIGVYRNAIETIALIDAEYVAMCEGDDYWIDPLKLQKQVDFLDENKNFSICFHPAYVECNGTLGGEITPNQNVFSKEEYEFNDILNHNMIPSAACVYRWNIISAETAGCIFPKKEIVPLDWFLNILHVKQGLAKCLGDTMSVYRRHEDGMWQANPEVLNLRYGVQQVAFFWAVYAQVTDLSMTYYNAKFRPFLKQTLVMYLKYGKLKEIECLQKAYPDAYDDVSKEIYETISFELRVRSFMGNNKILRRFASISIDEIWDWFRNLKRRTRVNG